MATSMTFKQFSNFLNNREPEMKGKLEKAIKLCCQKVRSDIQYDMAHTPRNTSKSYYTHNKSTPHHPSMPGNPPAPDTGNLRNSIRYEVHGETSKEVYGIVGSTQKDPPYGTYLEYGTSDGKIAPRPWLRPAMRKNNEFIRNTIAEAVAKCLGGGTIND